MRSNIPVILGLGLIAASSLVLAKGKPDAEEQSWDAEMSGAITGLTHSNLTALKGNVWNLVFNKPGLGSYSLSQYFLDVTYDQGDGGACFGGGAFNSGTMHLLDDNQDGLMARFWFTAKDSSGMNDVQYVLELKDTAWNIAAGETGPFWSGNFPPLAADGVVSRTAESWSLNPTRNRVKNACSMGYADFDDATDYVTVHLECATCQ